MKFLLKYKYIIGIILAICIVLIGCFNNFFMVEKQIPVKTLANEFEFYVDPALNFDDDDAHLMIDMNDDEFTKKNKNKKVQIASLSKLMTMWVLLEDKGEDVINSQEELKITPELIEIREANPESSGVDFRGGEQLTVEKLIQLSLIYSDNVAMSVLAKWDSESLAKHVVKMNESAKELGMKNTGFYNVTGLDESSKETTNFSTAEDLAKLSKKLVQKYPGVLKITSRETVEYKGIDYMNSNEMLEGGPFYYPGMRGLKTGTTLFAKQNFIGYLEKEDKQCIVVVLGVDFSDNRFLITEQLLNAVFDQVNDRKEQRK